MMLLCPVVSGSSASLSKSLSKSFIGTSEDVGAEGRLGTSIGESFLSSFALLKGLVVRMEAVQR